MALSSTRGVISIGHFIRTGLDSVSTRCPSSFCGPTVAQLCQLGRCVRRGGWELNASCTRGRRTVGGSTLFYVVDIGSGGSPRL